MNDMRAVIAPKSDQLNADDLLAGPITVTIREVSIRPGTEQPVSIFYDGDNGKPYKCCKSMARVMVHCWGADANQYVGRSMTLYCDPKVKWGGMAVGGIRISHMSDLNSTVTMALTETKGSKKPFIVQPLKDAPHHAAKADPETFIDRADRELRETDTPATWLKALVGLIADAPTADDVAEMRKFANVQTAETTAPIRIRQQVREAFEAALKRLAPVDPPAVENAPENDDGWPGPTPEQIRAEREAAA